MDVPPASRTHLVLIPSYNTGAIVLRTVRQACARWDPVWVVIDGSTDDTPERLEQLQKEIPRLHLMRLERNQGKGAAVYHGLKKAIEEGFTHVLCLDSDGQHPVESIPAFMEESSRHPEAMILGKPLFGKDAPIERVLWRKVSNFLSSSLILSRDIGDSLFGMRVYPMEELRRVMEGHRHARRFDFDPEVAIRLAWEGVPIRNLATPVRYPSKEEGGVSQFRYLRDNLLLGSMYVRLLGKLLTSLPKVVRSRSRRSRRRKGHIAKA